jgi:DNA-directed RNA polymerase II subunit RPB2
VYLSSPQLTEKDGTSEVMRPMVARLRNLTYAAPLFVDVSKTVTEVDENGQDIRTLEHEVDRMALGKIPIMLQSSFCSLKGLDNKGLTDMGEW